MSSHQPPKDPPLPPLGNPERVTLNLIDALSQIRRELSSSSEPAPTFSLYRVSTLGSCLRELADTLKNDDSLVVIDTKESRERRLRRFKERGILIPKLEKEKVERERESESQTQRKDAANATTTSQGDSSFWSERTRLFVSTRRWYQSWRFLLRCLVRLKNV